MAWERTSVGLDVPARSVVAGVLDTTTGQLWSQRLPAATPAVVSWSVRCPVRWPWPMRLARPGWAGPGVAGGRDPMCGGGAVPARTPARDRVKTDRRDADRLARLLHIGELPPVRTEAEEATRDVVRARGDARADLMRACHRLSKLRLRHGLVWQAAAWTRPMSSGSAPWGWASSLAWGRLRRGYGAVLAVQARRDRLDSAIGALAATSPWAPLVGRLGCRRGVGS